jgi:hypothetical protein
MAMHQQDPHWNVAVVFACFMCDECGDALVGENQSGESYGPGDDWYHRFGKYARRLGWHAETLDLDRVDSWRVLCPSCAKGRTA